MPQLLKKIGTAGIALYAALLIIVGYGLINLDNKGTDRPSVNTHAEWLLLLYVFVVGVALMLVSYRIYKGKAHEIKRIIWFPLAVLLFHMIYLLAGATGEAVGYIIMLHAPLLVGIMLCIAAIRSKELA